jgi:hypothetical protein
LDARRAPGIFSFAKEEHGSIAFFAALQVNVA